MVATVCIAATCVAVIVLAVALCVSVTDDDHDSGGQQ